jgi:hypothetical protein
LKNSSPEGGKVLKNLTPEGGKVLKKSSGKGPYVLRTDRADGRSAKHLRPVATDDATGGLRKAVGLVSPRA